ncbi:hypothetical protein R1flu_015730 [Riccia fluitans]|uniref:Uncharacterized protein n=1 Tax=Riccia fluitans TaxID=41844 RepID=A0ABD1YMZ1_9MARC
MKLFTMILILAFASFILCNCFQWHFTSDGFSDQLASCPLCECACSEGVQGSVAMNMALTELLQGMLTDCGQVDSDSGEIRDEVKVHNYERLRNALTLQLIRSRDAEEETQRALTEAEEKALRSREEVGRCLGGLRIVEIVRAKVDADLRKEKKSTSTWERRARALGWKG